METSGFLFDPSLCRGNMLFLGNGGNPLFQGATSMMTVEESSKKRPFFGSGDEFFDDEYYYDEQGSDKKRRLTAEQVHLLEKSFETENKLEPERKTQLAKKLGLQPRQVAVWFQNRRARWKTKQLERDYDLLKSSYDSLLNKYDSVAKHNEQLKSEVISLSEKLQPKGVEVVPISNNLVETEDDGDASAGFIKNNTRTVEEWVSSGSGASAVVDEESPQLVDSGDSYFPYPSFVGPINGVYAEEDDGSDDGRNYLSNVMAVAEQQRLEEEEEQPLEWWMWPLEE